MKFFKHLFPNIETLLFFYLLQLLMDKKQFTKLNKRSF